MQIKWVFVFFSLLLLPGNIFAAELHAIASLDRSVVNAGQPLRLTLHVMNAAGNVQIQFPTLFNLNIAQGHGSVRSLQLNDATVSSQDFNFALLAQRPGTYSLAGIKVIVNGKSLQIETVRFTAMPKEADVSSPHIANHLIFLDFNLIQESPNFQNQIREQVLSQLVSSEKLPVLDVPEELREYSRDEASQYLRKNQWDLALQSAEKTLSVDSVNATAHEVAGEVYYLRQDLESAEKHFRAAYASRPMPYLKYKIEKLVSEMSAEKKFRSVDEEHFLIKYDGNQQEYEGFELRGLLRDSYRAISQSLDHYINRKTTVLFYDADRYFEVAGVPHWSGGLFDGKVRLPVRPGEGSEVKRVARHEVAHVFIDDLSHKSAPSWLHEGFAVYTHNQIEPVSQRELSILSNRQNIIPFKYFLQMSPGSIQASGGAEMAIIQLFYMQSYSFVNYLIERYGIFKIKQLAQAFGEGKNSEDAMLEVFHVPASQIEREWISKLY